MQRQSPVKKIILGITGSFGSGKSTVAKMFASYGAKLIDADKLAHRVISPQTESYKKICGIFGKGILKRNRTVDRRKLAQIVFDNKNLLKKLNAIIHPEVISMIRGQIKTAKSRIIILDAPLLLEAGLKKIVDKLIVIKITRNKQIERIQNRTSLSRPALLKRIACQIPLRLKERLADFVIDNSGTIKKTRKQAEEIWKIMRLSLVAKK